MKKVAMIITLVTILALAVLSAGIYVYYTSPVGTNKIVTINIEKGDTYSNISKTLYDNKLIKSEIFYKIYLKTNNIEPLIAGKHELNSNMNLKEIVNTLSSNSLEKSIRLTFKEGFNIRHFVGNITKNTNITEDEIYAKLKDQAFLNSLITKYWFISAEILNTNIYFPLEGYLYPDTYDFGENFTIEQIFLKILDNTELKLEPLKESIKTNDYTYHELLTLASIVDLEAIDKRQEVAGVFYNRLNHNISLGSDVTTYYAAGIDMGDRDLYKSELEDFNAYNTRSSKMAGKLPAGPICNPRIASIEAVLNPIIGNNYYFVADKNGKVYFTENYNDHLALIKSLKDKNLWFTY